MKRVLVLSNMYPSTDHPTFGIFVKNQIELLKSAELDVEVLSINNPGKGKMTTLMKYMSWFFRSFFYMAKNRKKLSLTHAHYAFPTGFISLIGKKLFRLPYVVTVHGGDIDKMAAKSPVIAKLTKRILNEAASVIVVGEKLREDVIGRFAVPESRVEVMSMGVDTSIFKKMARGEAREVLGLEKDRKVILFVGNLIREKGLVELVEAFSMLKDTESEATLYLMGSQKNSAFVEELKSIIQKIGVEDIDFKAPLGQVELARWMSAADVLALPSYHEGFGLVALEAMSAGTKVVGTDVGGLSYLLNDQAGILVEPKDSQALVAGLKEALDPASVAINEEVGNEKVANHSFETILRKVLAIYEAVGKKIMYFKILNAAGAD